MRHLGDARELLPSLIKSSIALLAMGWRAPCSPWIGERLLLSCHSPPLPPSLLRVCLHCSPTCEFCLHTGCEHESGDLSHWVATMMAMLTTMVVMMLLMTMVVAPMVASMQ